MSPTNVRDKRQICIPCVLGWSFILILLGTVLFWFFVAWTQRGVFEQLLVSADSLAKAAPPVVPGPAAAAGACCAGCGACAPDLGGALSLFGHAPFLPMLPILALLVFLAFVIFAGTAALILLLTGANPATLTQLGAFLSTALQLLPQIRQLAAALRTTADGLDQGETAANAISAGLGSAATAVGDTADAIDGVHIPGRDWRLNPIANSIFYNIERIDPPATSAFHDVAADLRSAEGQISTAAAKSGDLGKAFKEAAKRLREAAGVLDGMAP